MEGYIGRKLIKKEVVHHINENHNDNRIENLQIFLNNVEHLKYHTRMRKLNPKYYQKPDIEIGLDEYNRIKRELIRLNILISSNCLSLRAVQE